MRLDTRRISRIMFLLYIAAVGVLCLMKTDSLPKIPAVWLGIPADKIAHFCMFMPFPALAYRSYDINDFYADMAGLAAGAVLTAAFVIINSRRRRK